MTKINLAKQLRQVILHTAAALLLALGLVWTLLDALGVSGYAMTAAGVLLPLMLVWGAAQLNRWTKWLVPLGSLAAVAAWLLLGGMSAVKEVAAGVFVHFSGISGAMDMVALPATILLSLAVGMIAFALCTRDAGAYPALAVTVLAAGFLWLTDQADSAWWLMPSAASVLMLFASLHHGSLSLRRILPMAAVITCLAFCTMLTGGVTIQPMKDAADQLRQRIYDLFFFTDARDVFSLEQEGYYPQGRAQLGGKVLQSRANIIAEQGLHRREFSAGG